MEEAVENMNLKGIEAKMLQVKQWNMDIKPIPAAFSALLASGLILLQWNNVQHPTVIVWVIMDLAI